MYHFNLVDKLRETFIGKTQEELEKQRAFVSGPPSDMCTTLDDVDQICVDLVLLMCRPCVVNV